MKSITKPAGKPVIGLLAVLAALAFLLTGCGDEPGGGLSGGGLSYTVTFDSNGGSDVARQIVVQGGRASIPSGVTKEGYAIAGWYKDSGFFTEWDFDTDTVNANLILYAKWTAVSYRITYELNGGTQGANPATSYTIESAVTLPTPAKAGSIFDGWYGNEGFTGEAATQIPAGSTGDKTFWAKWSPAGTAGITVQYWINEQGHIAFTNGTSASVTTAAGQSVVIAASGTGYAGQKWYVNGAEDASKAGQSSFTFTGAGKAAGRYAVGLQVSKDGKYYYAEFIVTVTN
jgi:uncharacterized repeat protein (TIGR02543 family)